MLQEVGNFVALLGGEHLWSKLLEVTLATYYPVGEYRKVVQTFEIQLLHKLSKYILN